MTTVGNDRGLKVILKFFISILGVEDLPGRGHARVVDETSTVGHQHCCHCPSAESIAIFCFSLFLFEEDDNPASPADTSNERPREKEDWNLAEAVHAEAKPLKYYPAC